MSSSGLRARRWPPALAVGVLLVTLLLGLGAGIPPSVTPHGAWGSTASAGVIVVIVGVYAAVISLATRALSFSSPVAVAASTRAAAALFNPLRRRLQRLVDRRFNRARYDAEAALAAFTSRLREGVDAESVRSDLLGVVETTFEPLAWRSALPGGKLRTARQPGPGGEVRDETGDLAGIAVAAMLTQLALGLRLEGSLPLPDVRRRACSGGLAALAKDPATLPLRGPAPDALALAVGQGVLEARLADRAHLAHGLRRLHAGLFVGLREEDLDVDASAGCPLAPRGIHGTHIL